MRPAVSRSTGSSLSTTRALVGIAVTSLLGGGLAAIDGCVSGTAYGPDEIAAVDAAASASDAGSSAADIVDVQLLAFNDFHGNLRPPSPSNAVVVAKPDDQTVGTAGDPTPTDAGVTDGGPLNVQVYAGGASYFAAHVAALREGHPNTLLVSAGDMVGASPLVSSSYEDEPTVRVMNQIGVDVASIGNHEFDRGPAELLRLQYGGCNFSERTDGGFGELGSCEADPDFPGASWEYLAANVDVGATTKTLFPPYTIRTVGGAKIALIGMTLKGTPTIVSPTGVAGLDFTDEIATTNALVPILKEQNVDAIVVLVHQGGFQDGTYNECVGLTGDILPIAMGLDPAVSVIHSAHTHVAYNCVVNGRVLTSAASYGRLISQINLKVDTKAHKVTSVAATNVIVTRDITPEPSVDALVNRYVEDIAPIAERQVGSIRADISKTPGANGETPLGDVITDGMLASDPQAVVAFTNIGGIRDSLLYKHYYSEPDGDVTFEKAESVLPFSDNIVSMTCKGSDIIAAVQQNVFVQAGGGSKVLQVSGLTYAWSAGAADSTGANAADPTSFQIGGAPIEPTSSYEVVAVDFIQSGGDGYTAFENCTLKSHIGVDLDVFDSYLGAHPNLAPPAANRITRNP